jgi:mono/diheme cytochrome c family protein
VQKGAKLYEAHCADCHGLKGEGRAGAYPALAGNRAVTQQPANNLINTVLHGGFAPATAGNPRPFGMPPFVLKLGDADVAAVLSYIRNAWGNRADGVSEFDINKFRRAQSP